MPTETLTIVFNNGTFHPEYALKAIHAELTERHVPSSDFKLYGKPLDLAQVWPRLKRARRVTFGLAGHGFDMHLSSVRNFQLDFLEIKTTGEDRTAWDNWAARFISHQNFDMAWLADAEYEHWQNAHDLLQYTAVGKPHEHLPKKSNGLPYPVERTIIDTSANPGRRLLRQGYIEVVGGVMWLGESFWQLTKANKAEVERAEWLQVSKPEPTVIRIEASSKCFTTAEGEEGKLQRQLRSLLFPSSTTQP